MAAGSRKDAGPRPTFVFKGRVEQLGRATMPGVPVDDRTAVVRVEEVLEAPESLAANPGEEITVQLAGRGRVEPGQQLVFHATPWMYGEGLAVRALRQESATTARGASKQRASLATPPRGVPDLRARLDHADLVVAGRVKEVRLPSPAAARRAGVAPISEHSPEWREAVIEVDDVLKGRHNRKRLVVRFPASTDVRWHQAPKFEAGQEGYFLLHRAEADPASPRRRTRSKAAGEGDAPPATAPAYTALDPDDFQARGSGIEALVK